MTESKEKLLAKFLTKEFSCVPRPAPCCRLRTRPWQHMLTPCTPSPPLTPLTPLTPTPHAVASLSQPLTHTSHTPHTRLTPPLQPPLHTTYIRLHPPLQVRFGHPRGQAAQGGAAAHGHGGQGSRPQGHRAACAPDEGGTVRRPVDMLHVHCMYTACALHVHTACTHCMYTLHAHTTHTPYALHAHTTPRTPRTRHRYSSTTRPWSASVLWGSTTCD